MMENVQEQTWRRVHERLRTIAKRRAALDAEEARCLREADALKLWRRLGYVHMHEYLERELGYSPQVGLERLRIAHALADLPLIEADLADGRLAYSAVRELTRVATAETEADWLDKARGKNLREIEAMVSGKKRGDRPDDPSDPDLEMHVLRLELAPEVFALFRQVQCAMADEYGGRLDDSAVIEILCRRALEGSGGSDRPPYQIAISVCESCGRASQNGAGRQVDVGREVVERARCDAEMIGSVTAAEPERVRTTVTPRMRRQVLARDQYRCTVPGCRSSRNLDIHHIEYRSTGGGNEMWNVTVLCSGHHRSLHDGLLVIRGKAPDALEFAWQQEQDYPPIDHGAPSPGEASPHLRGERGTSAAHRVDRRCAVVAKPIETLERAACVEEPPNPAAIDDHACLALITAGYKASEARAAVNSARPHVGTSATLEQMIREALRRCACLVFRRGVPRIETREQC